MIYFKIKSSLKVYFQVFLVIFLIICPISYALSQTEQDEETLLQKEHNRNLEKTTKPPNETKHQLAFLFDRDMSPYSSYATIISIRESLNFLEDKLISKHQDKFLVRYSSSVVDTFINRLLVVSSHEFFGHGYRVRASDNKVSSYRFSGPLCSLIHLVSPIGGMGAATTFVFEDVLTEPEIDILENIET